MTDLAAGLDAWRQDALFGPANGTPSVGTKLRKMIIGHAILGQQSFFGSSFPSLDPPAYGSLNQITAPLLVVVGQDDLAEFHLMAQLIRDESTNAVIRRLVEVPEAGHMSNMENPSFVSGLLLSFLLDN